jgi:hypothetical protein
MMSMLCNCCVRELLILARTWFAFGLPSETGCDNGPSAPPQRIPTGGFYSSIWYPDQRQYWPYGKKEGFLWVHVGLARDFIITRIGLLYFMQSTILSSFLIKSVNWKFSRYFFGSKKYHYNFPTIWSIYHYILLMSESCYFICFFMIYATQFCIDRNTHVVFFHPFPPLDPTCNCSRHIHKK